MVSYEHHPQNPNRDNSSVKTPGMESHGLHRGGHSSICNHQRSLTRSRSVEDQGRLSDHYYPRKSYYRPSRRLEYRDDHPSLRSSSDSSRSRSPPSGSRGGDNHPSSGLSDDDSPRRHRRGKKRYLKEGFDPVELGDPSDGRHRERSSRYDRSSEDESSGDHRPRHRDRYSCNKPSAHSREVGRLKPTSRSLSQQPPPVAMHPNSDSDSDLNSIADEELPPRDHHNRNLMATGFATLATVHIARSISKKLKMHNERNRKLHEDEISLGEARKQRIKNYLKDAASVGLAVLAIKNAVSDWQAAAKHLKKTGFSNQKSKQYAEKLPKRHT